ncbi:MAG: hemerythrin domain-containing protein [Chitinophagaceae bacterium]
MNRYNIFYQVHKGLRALLFETGSFLLRTDFTNEEQFAEVNEKINEVQHLFDKHAHTEDGLILPAIESYEPSVVDAFENEHKQDLALSVRLKNVIAALADADNEYDRAELGKSLNVLFFEFTAFNLAHMAKEETILNKLLWRYHNDDELKQMTRQIINDIHPDDTVKYNKWMLRGLNNSEIIGWLKNVKNGAPDFTFRCLMKQCGEEMEEQRWSQVQEQLSEGVLLA